jgi:hypothetical protein
MAQGERISVNHHRSVLATSHERRARPKIVDQPIAVFQKYGLLMSHHRLEAQTGEGRRRAGAREDEEASAPRFAAPPHQLGHDVADQSGAPELRGHHEHLQNTACACTTGRKPTRVKNTDQVFEVILKPEVAALDEASCRVTIGQAGEEQWIVHRFARFDQFSGMRCRVKAIRPTP